MSRTITAEAIHLKRCDGDWTGAGSTRSGTGGRSGGRSLTNSSADADDVLQEATVRLLRFIQGYRGGDSRSWVVRVARNTALTWLQSNRRRNDREWTSEAEVEVDECEDLFAIEARRRESEALRLAISTLTREQREIIVLRDLNGFQYSEIAVVLSIPMGTVMSRLSRARAVLQQRLLWTIVPL
jgi:RNA polymerase sigma factor (sigma-70 family)